MMRSYPSRSRRRFGYILVVVLVVGACLYYFLTRIDEGAGNENNAAANTNAAIAAVNTTTDGNVNFLAPVALDETYENSEYDFTVKYPEAYAATTSTTGQGSEEIFSVTMSGDGDSVSVSVADTAQEALLRNSISVSSELETEVDRVAATRLEGGSAKDGSPVVMILVPRGNQLYVLRGFGNVFEEIVASFSFQ